MIQARDLDEAMPWLNRMGQIQYLQGVPQRELFHSTARPKEETAEGSECVTGAIWQTVYQLVTVSQDVVKACGHLLQIKISQIAKHKSLYSLLLAYLNPTNIQKHIAPWQKIIMFFAYTQVGRVILINLYFPGYSPVSKGKGFTSWPAVHQLAVCWPVSGSLRQLTSQLAPGSILVNGGLTTLVNEWSVNPLVVG